MASGAGKRERRSWMARGASKVTTVRITEHLREAIEAEAAAEGIGFSDYVRRALIDSVAGGRRG